MLSYQSAEGEIEKEISVHLLAYNLIHPNIANAALSVVLNYAR